MNLCWRAANDLSVAQIHLLDNPLLREPLKIGHVKPRLPGHCETTPGLNVIDLHLNRIISAGDVGILLVAGRGHGAPGVVASAYPEDTDSELYPGISQDEEGLRRFVRPFSFADAHPAADRTVS